MSEMFVSLGQPASAQRRDLGSACVIQSQGSVCAYPMWWVRNVTHAALDPTTSPCAKVILLTHTTARAELTHSPSVLF